MSGYASSPERVAELIQESWNLYRQGIEEMVGPDRTLVATCVLYSGGNDSTLLAHLFRGVADFAIHANTTIGVEETRQFVRDTCKEWGLPLMEEHPPVSYRELVLEQGYPGPGHHYKMYQRLKERCLRQARKKLVTRPRKERVIFLAGRRRSESARRAMVPEMEREGSTVWVSPLVNWRAEDMAMYRSMNPDIPRNPVAEKLGMSGECLCGAFAQPGELDRIREHFPDVAAEIDSLEAEVQAKGTIPERRCQWGWGAYKDHKTSTKPKTGPMCSSCDARWVQPELIDPSEQLQAIRAKRRKIKEAVTV